MAENAAGGTPKLHGSDDRGRVPVKETDGDPLLRTLLLQAEEQGASFGITLYVQGLAVSGTVISTDEYLAGVAAMVRETGQGDGADAAAQTFDTVRKLFAEQRAEIDPAKRPLPRWIHLRDARTAAGSTLIPSNGQGFWRGRVRSIDGWDMGVMGEPS